jgi:hypothetical protein
MYSDLEISAFKLIDELLLSLSKNHSGGSFNVYNAGTPGQIALKHLNDYRLVNFRAPGNTSSIVDILPDGIKVLKAGGMEKYLNQLNNNLEEKENLQFEQLKLSVDELRKKFFDYDKKQGYNKTLAITGIISAVGSGIAVLLSLIALLK